MKMMGNVYLVNPFVENAKIPLAVKNVTQIPDQDMIVLVFLDIQNTPPHKWNVKVSLYVFLLFFYYYYSIYILTIECSSKCETCKNSVDYCTKCSDITRLEPNCECKPGFYDNGIDIECQEC